ncbi:cytochrome P450 [Fomitiporia mediterranea MF3/22]|uniref:cytochrome P450 n=1 Tax=Fomitiporia mediterranea (strain MF3/22) TaxID=694068 RepID=UPI0004407624|nr:cytochrome P450 [Fomitiporia mediterranea MF3/22]EJC99581.1 cytochrome P450 [Fomitiporia mediterranea MF3/22]
MSDIIAPFLPVKRFVASLPFAACILCLALLKIVLFFIAYFKARGQFPGPPVSSLWSGNLSESMADDVHDKWRTWHRKYGPVFQTWNGLFSRVVYVGDPRIISKIGNSNWPKFHAQYSGFKPLSGSALFAQMDQERWKQQRKGLAPAFQPITVNDQYPMLQRYLTEFIEVIDAAARSGSVIDLSTLHVLLTLDFVGEVAFGAELNALRDGASCRILQIFHDILPELMKCGLFPLRSQIPIMESTRRMHRSIKELRGMAHVAVKNARSSEEKSAVQPGSKRIYEILAQLSVNLKLLHVLVTFLPLLFQLRNPEILAKVRTELDEVLPPDSEIPTVEQASRLRYLHLVIKETLRYNGPGFGTFRYTSKDVEINGVTLPANTTLALWNPQVHRDPKLWGPDSDEFRPERWLVSTGSTSSEFSRFIPPPGSYFPFSYGPRKCLGEGLAILEMSLTLATLFKRYDLKLQEGFVMEFLPSFTLCSKNGLPVTARVRAQV